MPIVCTLPDLWRKRGDRFSTEVLLYNRAARVSQREKKNSSLFHIYNGARGISNLSLFLSFSLSRKRTTTQQIG